MRRFQRGFSMIETVIALGLVSLTMLAAVYFIANSHRGTTHNKEKEFAVQKAISMFDELKTLVEKVSGNDITILDDYDDGAVTNPVLTTTDAITDPSAAISGNYKYDPSNWTYERQITVQKFPSLQTNDIRLVNVRVYARNEAGLHQLAEVSGVIRTLADRFPPTQVYDVYCLAIENVPGWWVYMANLIPFVENAIQDLQARNPGLSFRTHWVRQLSFGRDPFYTPFVNNSADSNADIDSVYFYPGTMPSGSSVSQYYVPAAFAAKINIDGTVQNDYDATTNPAPYTLADNFNHAMRYPDEVALFNQRVASGAANAGTPTWRMLIEGMFSRPDLYSNAILINVHGELFPFPPLRNYSDAAKEPVTYPGVRVVSHPENLRYDNSSDVNVRVYSYLMNPDDVSAASQLDTAISVLFPGQTWNPASITVQAMKGGIDVEPADGTLDAYSLVAIDQTEDFAGEMFFVASNEPEGTLIKLYNSPLKSPCGDVTCSTGGLDATRRLFDLEYLPAPFSGTTDAPDFDRDLDDTGVQTKNSARWVITIPDAEINDDEMITIETRLGEDLVAGTMYPTANTPSNLSRTYAWRGSDTWIFGDGTVANLPNLPLTERFQIMGDPRHVPYADIKATYDATNRRLGLGYNRYFDDFHNASGNFANDATYWPNWTGVKNDATNNNDGWNTGSGNPEVDINRIFQLLRSSLMRCNAVYTTMTGFSYYYVGVGNEIGYDAANGFTNSIPTSAKPFTGAAGSRWEDSITTAQTGGVKWIREDVANGWWGINWLGELYPDDQFSNWEGNGNLATGTGAGTFRRVLRTAITWDVPTGTTYTNAMRRLTEEGSTTLFSIGTNSSKFHHEFRDGQTGSLQTKGTEIASNFNFPIPSPITINRPFALNLNGAGGVPDHYQQATYTGGTNPTATNLATYYNHQQSGRLGSALLSLRGGGSDGAYIVANGIAQTNQSGSAFIGKWSFLTLIHSFLEAGTNADTTIRIHQVPRVAITAPNDLTDLDNPSTIDIAWTSTWKRWDDRKYTLGYADDFAETDAVIFIVMYSRDSGRTWYHAQDDSLATPGAMPSDTSLHVADTNYSWSVPSASFPRGSYWLRVEAYRSGYALHYALHQQKVYIKR